MFTLAAFDPTAAKDKAEAEAQNAAAAATVKQWVTDLLPPSLDASSLTVMVNEVQCFEPDCAPLEVRNLPTSIRN